MASSKRERELARQRAARQAARRAERDRRRKQRNAVFASVLAVALVAGAAVFATVAAGGDDPDTLAGDPTPSPSAASEAVTVGPCSYQPGREPSKPVEPPSEQDLATEGTRTATLTTDRGPITVELLAAQAPCATTSFLSLARQGFFDDSPCHRLTTSSAAVGLFVLQCGDPSGEGNGGPGYTFAEENLEGATYPRGTVAMAKAPPPATSGSQFFLVYKDSELPPEYTPFGRIVGGIEVLDEVAAGGSEPPDENGTTAPTLPIRIESVEAA